MEQGKQKKRRWLWVLVPVLVMLAGSTALHLMNFPAVYIEKTENGAALYIGHAAKEKQQEQQETLPVVATAPVGQGQTLTVEPSGNASGQPMEQGGMTLQALYEAAWPSVVTITTESYSGRGFGTGVIMSGDGYIITNQHVIENAVSLEVWLHDDTVYPAALVGGDVVSDLAVLKIGATGLKAAEFGDSSTLRVGDRVVAIGNPLGLSLRGTMTDGIVSGISRDLTVDGRKMSLIQTNAALNNGNSGGPLLNSRGQVVGINAVKLTDSYGMSGVEGLGFAIPSSTVKPIVDELIAKGYVAGRPALGLVVEELPLQVRLFYKLPEGAYIARVDPNSDAAKKGIQPGDIITALNGQPVSGPASLSTLKGDYQAGDAVTLTIFRRGGFVSATVILMDQVTGET